MIITKLFLAPVVFVMLQRGTKIRAVTYLVDTLRLSPR
jgi:hypothetical protein